MPYGPSRNARGAGNPGQRVVQFTLQDAQRISSAVHEIESSRRGHTPSMLPRAVGTGGTGLDIVQARILKASLDAEIATWPAGAVFEPGAAIALTWISNYTLSRTLYPTALQSAGGNTNNLNTTQAVISTAPFTWPTTAVTSLSLLPALDKTASSRWLDFYGTGYGNEAAETFGVISDISNDDSHYFVKVIVGGVFQCRVVAYSDSGNRVLGPPPRGGSDEIKAMWRPYLMTSPAGPGRILSVGNCYKLGATDWPRVYEAIVRL